MCMSLTFVTPDSTSQVDVSYAVKTSMYEPTSLAK